MNADTVAHSEFDVMTVKHRHQPFFEVVVVAERGAFAEIACPDSPLAVSFGWKMCTRLGRNSTLGVDEKQRDDEVGFLCVT